MYAQLVETGVKQVKTADQLEGREQTFQRRIDDGVRIEAKDWMPEAYRKTLVRQICLLYTSCSRIAISTNCRRWRTPKARCA